MRKGLRKSSKHRREKFPRQRFNRLVKSQKVKDAEVRSRRMADAIEAGAARIGKSKGGILVVDNGPPVLAELRLVRIADRRVISKVGLTALDDVTITKTIDRVWPHVNLRDFEIDTSDVARVLERDEATRIDRAREKSHPGELWL